MQPVGDTGASSVSPTGSRSPRRQQRRDVEDRPAWRQRLTLLDAKVTPYVFVSPFFLLFLGFIRVMPSLSIVEVKEALAHPLKDPAAHGGHH